MVFSTGQPNFSRLSCKMNRAMVVAMMARFVQPFVSSYLAFFDKMNAMAQTAAAIGMPCIVAAIPEFWLGKC